MDTQMTALPPVAPLNEMLREQLTDRRQRLQVATAREGYDPDFGRLLAEVDAALLRYEKGTYGICEECHEAIEPECLLADPLMRVCLGDLTVKQRQSLEDDLELAATIQLGLLPKKDRAAGFAEIDFVYQPAGIVSGDYVDIIPHDGEVYFILGDVSGKGMAASLMMSNLHAMFHSLVPLGLPLTELMARANHLFAQSTLASQYATLICGKISAAGEVEFCNAGHLPPVVIRNGEATLAESGALPLGMFCETSFDCTSLKLEAGDTLMLYTDGATEANDHFGGEFGIDRLLDSVVGLNETGPEYVVRNTHGAIESFRGHADRNDDLTLLALRFAG